MKKFLKGIVLTLIFISGLLIQPALAVAEQPVRIFINGQQQSMEVDPVLDQGSTFIPVKSIFQAFAYTLNWDEASQTITAAKEDVQYQFKIGAITSVQGPSATGISVTPKMINGSMMVPLKVISEMLGYSVTWDGKTRTVYITETAAIPLPVQGERILVFAPHPDDETLAVGGYLFMGCKLGADIKIVLVTDGNKVGLRDLRYQEFFKATAKLGIADNKLVFWGYPDGSLGSFRNQAEDQINLAIKSFKPQIIIYPHPQDIHVDHAILGKMTEAALSQYYPQDPSIKTYAYLIHYKNFPGFGSGSQKLLPPADLSGQNARWGLINLSAEAQLAKQSALQEYPSQQKKPQLISLFKGMMSVNELLAIRTLPSSG